MILTTRLTGVVTAEDVERWKESLARDAAAIPDGGTFKLLLDLRGYEPADMDAHKAMRVVIPLFLADYGFRTAFLDLFPGSELPLRSLRGIACTAFANVHHDAAKMQNYEERIGGGMQRHFTDPEAALAWLESV